MKRFLASGLLLLSAVASASPNIVTFTGNSIHAQPIKVSLVEQEDDTYNLLLTTFEHDQQNGLSTKTTEIAANFDCEIDELHAVNCETVTADGEFVRFYSKPSEQARRFLVVVETNGWPYALGYSMVWETR